LIERESWALETSVFGTFIHVSVPDESAARTEIGRLLGDNGITLKNVERITPSLEDVFIYLLDQEAKKAA